MMAWKKKRGRSQSQLSNDERSEKSETNEFSVADEFYVVEAVFEFVHQAG